MLEIHLFADLLTNNERKMNKKKFLHERKPQK